MLSTGTPTATITTTLVQKIWPLSGIERRRRMRPRGIGPRNLIQYMDSVSAARYQSVPRAETTSHSMLTASSCAASYGWRRVSANHSTMSDAEADQTRLRRRRWRRAWSRYRARNG